MRDEKGRFIKGHRASKKTEFKKGRHWRKKKPYWDREWLIAEYVEKKRTASEIADQFNCHENNILYFINKHDIQTRNVSETRKIKHWGAKGENNPMYGVTGENNPNWKGGLTPERQSFYSSIKWKKVSSKIWKRDKATCQRCGISGGKNTTPLHIHHIISFQVRKHRTDINNLILLCEDCHRWVHSKKNTESKFIREEAG